MSSPIPPALSVHEAAALLRVSRTQLYRLIGSGDVAIRKLGGRTIVLGSSLERLLDVDAAGAGE